VHRDARSADLLTHHGEQKVTIACQSIRQPVREASEEENLKDMVVAKRALRRMLNGIYAKAKAEYDEAHPAPKAPAVEPASKLAVAISDEGNASAPKGAMAAALASAGVAAPSSMQ
jgi:hypothetical protein